MWQLEEKEAMRRKKKKVHEKDEHIEKDFEYIKQK